MEPDGSVRMGLKVDGRIDPIKIGKDVEEAKIKGARASLGLDKKTDESLLKKAGLTHLSSVLQETKGPLKSLIPPYSTVLNSSIFDKSAVQAFDLSTGLPATSVDFVLTGRVPPQNFTVDSVTQLATQDTVMGSQAFVLRDFMCSSVGVSGQTTALGASGALSLGFEGESSVLTFNLQPDWGLGDIVTAINQDPRFEARAILEPGTLNTYGLLISAGASQGGKILTLDTSAVQGIDPGVLPTPRLGSVTLNGVSPGNGTVLYSPPADTFDIGTQNITGFLQGTVSSVQVTPSLLGSDPYTITVGVQGDFGQTSLVCDNFTPGAGVPLVLTHSTTGSQWRLECAANVSGLGTADEIRGALEQILGIQNLTPTTWVSPSSVLTNGVSPAGISADATVPQGTYSLSYDASQGQFKLSNGVNEWVALPAGSGAQPLTFNGITLLLEDSFDAMESIDSFTFQVTDTGIRQLQDKSTMAAGWEGEMRLGTLNTPPTSITLKKEWSLEKVMATINARKDSTGVIVRMMGDRFEFVSKDVAVPLNVDISGVRGVASGVLNGVSYANPLSRQDALSTKYRVNGIDQTVADISTEIVPGLLVEFKSSFSNDKSVRFSVDTEASEVAEAIGGLFKNINKVLDEYQKLQTDPETLFNMTEEEKRGYGALRNTSLLRELREKILSSLTQSFNNKGSLHQISEMGIDFNTNSGRFDLNSETLIKAIAKNLESVKNIFASSHTLSDDAFVLAHGPKSGQSALFSLKVSRNASGAFNAFFTSQGKNYTATVKEVGESVFFDAPPGSPLEGVTLGRTLSSIPFNSSLQVTAETTLGIAESLKNVLESFTDPDTGHIVMEMKKLETQDDLRKEQTKRIETAAKKAGAAITADLMQAAKSLAKLEEIQGHVRTILKAVSQDE